MKDEPALRLFRPATGLLNLYGAFAAVVVAVLASTFSAPAAVDGHTLLLEQRIAR
jgi:hypothetical protein